MGKHSVSFVAAVLTLLLTSCVVVESSPAPSYNGGYSNDYASSTGYGADYIYSSTYYGQRPYWVNRFSAPEADADTPLASEL